MSYGIYRRHPRPRRPPFPIFTKTTGTTKQGQISIVAAATVTPNGTLNTGLFAAAIQIAATVTPRARALGRADVQVAAVVTARARALGRADVQAAAVVTARARALGRADVQAAASVVPAARLNTGLFATAVTASAVVTARARALGRADVQAAAVVTARARALGRADVQAAAAVTPAGRLNTGQLATTITAAVQVAARARALGRVSAQAAASVGLFGSVNGSPGLFDEFSARGHDAFPFGAYPRREDFQWMWRQMLMCLPFHDGSVPGGGVGSDYDIGPYKYGGGVAMTGSSGIYPGKSDDPDDQPAGNHPIVFPGGSSGTDGTGQAAQWFATSVNMGEGSIPSTSHTLMFVMTPRQFNDALARFLYETRGFFDINPQQQIWFQKFFGAKIMAWQVQSGQLHTFAYPAFFDSGDRVVAIFTQGNPGGAQVYFNGRLAFSSATVPTVKQPGLGSVILGGSLDFPRETQCFRGTVELFYMSNEYWTADQAAFVSAQPFAFLEPQFPVPAPPFKFGQVSITAAVQIMARAKAMGRADIAAAIQMMLEGTRIAAPVGPPVLPEETLLVLNDTRLTTEQRALLSSLFHEDLLEIQRRTGVLPVGNTQLKRPV